jgi:hypothetical protein
LPKRILRLDIITNKVKIETYINEDEINKNKIFNYYSDFFIKIKAVVIIIINLTLTLSVIVGLIFLLLMKIGKN